MTSSCARQRKAVRAAWKSAKHARSRTAFLSGVKFDFRRATNRTTTGPGFRRLFTAATTGAAGWTLNVQTDLGRDIRNETLFALSNLRTSSASLTVKLSRSANLRFEYYGTRLNYELNRDSILASALLGNSVEPVLGGANRNVFFVQYQKTLRWGSRHPPNTTRPRRESRLCV